MRKLLLLLLFLCSFQSFGSGTADSLTAKPKDKTPFVLSTIPVDTATIGQRVFPENLKKKYDGSSFTYEFKTPEKNAWDRFKEWLAGLFRNLFNFSTTESSLLFVAILLKAIAVLIVVVVIYLIVKSILNKEGKWVFGKSSDKKIIRYTEVEKNLKLADFEQLIRSTLESGEKRLSIRYYYLWLLKKMSAAQMIEWDVEKTNSDYLYEIQNQAKREEFAYLSYLYNYSWYGEFELDESDFNKAKTAFENAIKSIRNE